MLGRFTETLTFSDDIITTAIKPIAAISCSSSDCVPESHVVGQW